MGNGLFHAETMSTLIEIIANYFAIGLKIAIPIVLIMIITDVAMGLVSRAVPQINVMILGMPVKMLVGILAISVSLPIIIKLFISSVSYLPDIFRKIITTVPTNYVYRMQMKEQKKLLLKRKVILEKKDRFLEVRMLDLL